MTGRVVEIFWKESSTASVEDAPATCTTEEIEGRDHTAATAKRQPEAKRYFCGVCS
jgi:hypothetical protein